MRYECPSCYLTWKDKNSPVETKYFHLCSFCCLPHTQKELLNWQMDHIEDLNNEKFFNLLRHFYRFVDIELKILKEKLDGK